LKPRSAAGVETSCFAARRGELERRLATLADRDWFRRHGVLIQELVPPLGYDLRVIVAGDRVVGAERREAAPGQWSTNEILGGRVMHAQPSNEEGALAIEAARAIGVDLLGVDPLPLPDGGYVVGEVNGAIDFDARDSLLGRNVYTDVADALVLGQADRPRVQRWAVDRHAERAPAMIGASTCSSEGSPIS
jgi:glutathione synthase/RimK-type ligase-like ATP-grasp enzyme